MLTKAELGEHGADIAEMLSELTEIPLEELLQKQSLATLLSSIGIAADGTEEEAENYRAFCDGLETIFEVEIPDAVRLRTIGDAIRFVDQHKR